MTRATLAQCQARYDNATDPRHEDAQAEAHEVAEGMAHTEIVDALTAGQSFWCGPYRIDAFDILDAMDDTRIALDRAMLAGDAIEARRIYMTARPIAVTRVADYYAPKLVEARKS